jgi:carboxyl-terminal processing protease
VASLVGLVLIVAGVAAAVLTSSGRLTNLVKKHAPKFVNCEIELGKADLTLFKTFPNIGVEIENVALINPMAGSPSDTLANITLYLDRLDSTEVMFDYVTEYIAKHPTIAAAKDFHLTDADYDDFKQRVIKGGFTYDQLSKKQMDELEKAMKFEGYMDDAKAEFEALKAKIDHHDVARDLDKNRQEIMQMIEQDIVSAYYYQGGELQVGLRNDKALQEAARILTTEGEYARILNVER